jgi:NAD(P)-dependent dehydrogenase (short-subunit alcohol dehydrogenase family)
VKDKICIVTGGNAGIGKATVAGLAHLDATIVIAYRYADKGKAAKGEIATKTPASAR